MRRVAWAVGLALVLGFVPAAAQKLVTAPQVILDTKRACRITVPPDWIPDPETPDDDSPLLSAEKTMRAEVRSLAPGQDFERAKAQATREMRPVRILEDDLSRFVYLGRPSNLRTASKQRFTVILKTRPVCTASVTFFLRADERQARAVAGTLVSMR